MALLIIVPVITIFLFILPTTLLARHCLFKFWPGSPSPQLGTQFSQTALLCSLETCRLFVCLSFGPGSPAPLVTDSSFRLTSRGVQRGNPENN